MQFIGNVSVAYAKYPSVLINEMSLEDLVFLYRLYLVQPFGYRRQEFDVGLICSTIMNSQRASKDAKVWSPADFMPLGRVQSDDEDAINEQNLRLLQCLSRSQNRKGK